jgi:hypothetical protein
MIVRLANSSQVADCTRIPTKVNRRPNKLIGNRIRTRSPIGKNEPEPRCGGPQHLTDLRHNYIAHQGGKLRLSANRWHKNKSREST